MNIPCQFTDESLARAKQAGHFALEIGSVDLTKLNAVEPRELQIRKHLAGSGIIVHPHDIVIGAPHAGSKKQTHALWVIAPIHSDANKQTSSSSSLRLARPVHTDNFLI